MLFKTKYFGEVEIAKEKILTFSGAIYGFEELKDFFLINFEPEDDGMLCLQSADNPELAFVLFNPYSVMPTYEPKMTNEDFSIIKADNKDKLWVYVLAVIKENGDVTVNLKGPIVINPNNNLAAQLIIEGNQYSMRYPVIVKEG